jgi:hypothetical protein
MAAQSVYFQNLPFGQTVLCSPDPEGMFRAMPLKAGLSAAGLHIPQEPADVDGDSQVGLDQIFHNLPEGVQVVKDGGGPFPVSFLIQKFLDVDIIH